MNFKTEPIRDKKKIEEIFTYLKEKNQRNYVMAKIQINTGLRISDVLKLKVNDFLNSNLKFKEYLVLEEKKTKKNKMIAINKVIIEVLKEYIFKADLELNSYLFQSRKGLNQPITTTQAHRIYSKMAQDLNIEKFNSHSLRKTWGYFAYQKTKDVALIMDVYNHSSQKDTLKYIGITQQDKNSLYKKIYF